MSSLLLPMPPGSPGALEGYASTLSSAAREIDELASRTARVTGSVTSNADWKGRAADSYLDYVGTLPPNVRATASHLNQIASAVRNYAHWLRTAQKKVAAYNKAAEAASCLTPKKQRAALAALAGIKSQAEQAVKIADIVGDTAAADVKGSEAGLLTLASPFAPLLGSTGPDIGSVDLLQNVRILDLQANPPMPVEPEAEALPPDWQRIQAARKRFWEWLTGSNLPNDPHVPEDPPEDGGDDSGPGYADYADGL